jgi:RNA polymerase sigma-70 factor (ECF subfamily)
LITGVEQVTYREGRLERRVETTSGRAEEAAVIAAVRAGDQVALAALPERYRRQLFVHCYRMLGSVEDAEDVVQETLLRAWRARAGFQGRSLFRTWLYRIATNACLNALRRQQHRVMPPDVAPATADPHAAPVWRRELPWLQPYPDRLLEPAAPSEGAADPPGRVQSRPVRPAPEPWTDEFPLDPGPTGRHHLSGDRLP